MIKEIKVKIKYLIKIKNMSYSQVAQTIDIPKATVAYHATAMGIEPAKKQYPLHQKDLIELYINQKLSIKEVAKKLGCWGKKVSFWLKKYNIKTRPVGTNQFNVINFDAVKQKFNQLNLQCLTEEYVNSCQKLHYECKKCGFQGAKVVGQLKYDQGCNNCARKTTGIKRRVDESKIKKIVEDKKCTYIKSDFNSQGQRVIYYICHCGKSHKKLFGNFKKEKDCIGCKALRYKGENNPNWNPDLTEADRLQLGRYEPGYSTWRLAVFKKYQYKCDICGSQKNKQVHHLESYANNENLRTDINNGVCLCKNCHLEFHKTYGFGDNNSEQYFKFNNNR